MKLQAKLLMAVLLAAVLVALAPAAEPVDPESHTHLAGAWLDKFHNPAPGITMGADLRFREVYGWNLDTLKDDAIGRDSKWHFERYRMRWWTKFELEENVDFNLRFTWEFRTWDAPYSKDQSVDFDEIMFDTFNLTVRNLFDMPLTMVAGRQDIILGKGWLVLDGTPLDGSRTIFLDALRMTYDWDEDTKVDLIYIDNAAASDRWLKPINDRDKHTTEQDERGLILYVTDTSIDNTQLEGYFMYKNDNPVDVAEDFPASAWSKKAEIYTYGGAISGGIWDEHWKYRAEGALQTGDKSEQDLRAWGTKEELKYHFNDEKSNVLGVTYEYLSGDDPSTSQTEAFDPLWGEWPQWSELYVYCYNLETMIGETTNLQRLAVDHSFKPTPKWTIETAYHLLWANENTKAGSPHSSGLTWSNNGDFRGQLATCWLKYQCCKNLKAHFLVEYLFPGNYYASTSRDDAYFLRFNVEYVF